MNRTRTIALFAGIFAIAMTTYGLSGVSASPMIMASMIPQTQDVGILGHVEYTLFDNNDNIIAYQQGDNIVVNEGKDCAGRLLFGASTTPGGSACTSANALTPFTYIAIGNGTAGTAATDNFLDGDQCATTSNPGELARKLVSAETSVAAPGTAGTEITLDVKLDTFKFEPNNATNTNIITQSALFNGDTGKIAGTGECAGYTNSDWEMFAVRDLTGGIQVNSGDSLAVKWTITLN